MAQILMCWVFYKKFFWDFFFKMFYFPFWFLVRSMDCLERCYLISKCLEIFQISFYSGILIHFHCNQKTNFLGLSFFNVLTLVLLPRIWYVLINVLYAHEKSEFSGGVRWNVLWMSIRSSQLIVLFMSYSSSLIFYLLCVLLNIMKSIEIWL